MSTKNLIAAMRQNRTVPEGSFPVGVRLHSAEGYVTPPAGLQLRVPSLNSSELDAIVREVAQVDVSAFVREHESADAEN